jgi:hypothetical protein
LRVVIERCLAKQPEHRYQHAHDVRTALEAILAGTVSRSIAWRYQFHRRRRLLSVAAFLALAAALAGLNVGTLRDRVIGNPPAAAPLKLAVLPLEDLSGGVDQQYLPPAYTTRW